MILTRALEISGNLESIQLLPLKITLTKKGVKIRGRFAQHFVPHTKVQNNAASAPCIYMFLIISPTRRHSAAAKAPDRNLFIGCPSPLLDPPPRESPKRPLIKDVYINNPLNTQRRVRSVCTRYLRRGAAINARARSIGFQRPFYSGRPRLIRGYKRARRSMRIPQTSNGNSLIQQSS